MKKLIYTLSIALAFASCQKETTKSYVTLSGTIVNPNSDSLVVAQRNIIKTIKVNADGTFSDTLKVKTGDYVLFDGTEQASIFLKNGYDLKINLDTKKFDETISYKGNGAEVNNYLAKTALLIEKEFNYAVLMDLDKVGFDTKIASNKTALKAMLAATKNLDSLFVISEEENIDRLLNDYTDMYNEKQALLALNGKESPKFLDYENNLGGATSLDDLKGKYVYIDMWATWCGPCKVEIPFLKKIEKAYHGKNIEFVSISIDRKSDYDAWKKMVKEEELSGTQLWAKGDEKFVNDYRITGIPRFILIDPQGKVVNADAPRPSSDDLVALFNNLKI